MAAYAALASLMNTTERITDHPRLATSFYPKQMESLREIVDYLLEFMETCTSHGGGKEARDLESQIASAAHAAEDVIESHVVDQIHAGFDQHSSNSPLNLQKVIEEMDHVMLKVDKERGTLRNVQTYPKSSATTWTTKPLTTDMVGNDKELLQLLDLLTGHDSSRQIISIEGMGGIGKTTLSRNAFENRLIVQHFDIRGWVTISQSFSVRDLLLELLSCLGNTASPSEIDQEPEDELGLKLHKYLYGRRYLIVLDDIWSVESWDKLKLFFPDNDNRSRIVVTTRLSNVATQFSSSSLRMNFLDEDKGWELLCKTAFPQEDCPLELEDIGKKIVEKCKGLPLSIAVIGGFLAKTSRAKDFWEDVVRDINSILKSDNEDLCLSLLSLSYTHLPVHLKPCFLYMGILKEDQRIYVSRFIKLFVAEGFLRPNKIQSLEETAHDCIKDLVDRNLILVSKWKKNGTAKVCYIHDLLRELCLREAEKEKFLHVMSLLDMECGRRIVFNGNDPRVLDALPSAALVRSLLLNYGYGPLPSKCRLLKVLTTFETARDPLETVFQQVNLRYLLYKSRGHSSLLTSSASRLWNVQTLAFKGFTRRIAAPSEIWNMRQLRHIEFYEICLPDPPTMDQQEDSVLQNLQTLVNVVNFCFSKDVCKRIPNVKKLLISYDDFSDDCLRVDIGSLSKLQSLKCSFAEQMGDLAVELRFPSSLQKLSLSGSCLHFDNVTAVGLMMPQLQILNLDLVTGLEWNLGDTAFPSLKFLSISNSDLIYWIADESHFPVLEKLILRDMHTLNGIPLGFGEITTLGALVLRNCNESAAISSTKILEEQLSLGNEEIEVLVDLWDKEELTRFKEMVDTTHFSKPNFDCSGNGEFNELLRKFIKKFGSNLGEDGI